ncbi:Hypothetical protein FKW44_021159, partial [Caligus rogercresseyi]
MQHATGQNNLTSSVWKFFGFWAERWKILESRQKVICKVCKVELAYHSTTSTCGHICPRNTRMALP